MTVWTSCAVLALGIFVFINALTFMMFRIDKTRAINGDWRVSEGTLLFLALIGGWFGAKAARRLFRHKTRKEPFRSQLNRVPVIWVLIGLAVLFRDDVMAVLQSVHQL